MTRGESVATGDTYVQHLWTATAANLSDGAVTAPDGDLVETPDWIVDRAEPEDPLQVGRLRHPGLVRCGHRRRDVRGRHPHRRPQFLCPGRGLFGFCLPVLESDQQYTTRMMDDPAYGPITLPYLSWDDIQPGDTIHKHGHMRLTVTGLQDGSFLVAGIRRHARRITGSAIRNTSWRIWRDIRPATTSAWKGPRPPPPSSRLQTGSWTAGSTWVGGVAPDSDGRRIDRVGAHHFRG